MSDGSMYTVSSRGWFLNSSRLPSLPLCNLTIVEADKGDHVIIHDSAGHGGRIVLELTQPIGFNDAGMREATGIVADADALDIELGKVTSLQWPSTVPVHGSVMPKGHTPMSMTKEQWKLFVAQQVYSLLEVPVNKRMRFSDVLEYLVDNNVMPTKVSDLVETKKPPQPKNGKDFTDEEILKIRKVFLQNVCRRFDRHLNSQGSFISLTGEPYGTLAYTTPTQALTEIRRGVTINEKQGRITVFFPYLLISIIYFFKAFGCFHVVDEGGIPDSENSNVLKPEDRELIRRAFGKRRGR